MKLYAVNSAYTRRRNMIERKFANVDGIFQSWNRAMEEVRKQGIHSEPHEVYYCGVGWLHDPPSEEQIDRCRRSIEAAGGPADGVGEVTCAVWWGDGSEWDSVTLSVHDVILLSTV